MKKNKWLKRIAFMAAIIGLLSFGSSFAANAADSSVKGNQLSKNDADNNGISDAGVVVTGNYKEIAGDCTVLVQYRGIFNNDPYLDSGWVKNEFKCPEGNYQYTLVSPEDPRYTGNPEWAEWGTWEYTRDVESGRGNIVHRPTAG